MLTSATLLALLLAVGMPPAPDIRACEQQARATAGAPAVSPHAQPHASQPTDDAQPQSRPDDPAPQRQPPSPTPHELANAKSPLQLAADGRDAYRASFQSCLRARGY